MADGEEHASASDLEKKLKEKLGAPPLVNLGSLSSPPPCTCRLKK